MICSTKRQWRWLKDKHKKKPPTFEILITILTIQNLTESLLISKHKTYHSFKEQGRSQRLVNLKLPRQICLISNNANRDIVGRGDRAFFCTQQWLILRKNNYALFFHRKKTKPGWMWGGGVVGRFGIRPHFLQHFLAPFPKWSLWDFLYIFTLSSNRDCRELQQY